MSNEKFKVKFGLAVGDTSATIDGTTGNIITNGSVQLNGSSSGSTTLTQAASGSALTYVLPTAAGASSTVLTNDGSGNLSWALPGGGGSTFGNVTVGIDTDQTISTTSGNLILQTAAGVNAGTVTLTAGTNGNITLAPNGTGNVAFTLNNGGNITNTRNYTLNAIRNSTVASNGNVWAYQTTVSPTRGINLSNQGNETAYRPGVVLQGYSGSGAAGGRSWLVFENARGTAASPVAVGNGDRIVEMIGQGYNGTQWTGDVVANQPFSLRGAATEAWTDSPSRAGMRLEVLAQPAGVNYTGTSVPTIISHSPTTATYVSDSWTFRNRPVAAGGNNGLLYSMNGSNSTYTWGDAATGSANQLVLALSGSSSYALYGASSDGSVVPTVQYFGYRRSGGVNSATQLNDRLGQFRFGGNTNTTSGPPTAPVTGAEIRVYATENWTNTQTGTSIGIEITRTGTTDNTNVFVSDAVSTQIKGDTIQLQTGVEVGAIGITGNKLDYNRVYGQWQWDATVTPAGSNTAYAFPIQGASGTTDFANIASVASTSHIIPGAAGMYKLQFSVQVSNDDNASEHTAYFWWRKNGTDVPNSMGIVGLPKAVGASPALTIAGWDNMISSANTTDYWELMYAVDNSTHVTFPYFGTQAFGPATASLFITLVPIGA